MKNIFKWSNVFSPAHAFLLAVFLFSLVTSVAQAQTARNPWRQPYNANSVWNVPIGSNASLTNITVNSNGIGLLEGDVTYLFYGNPGDPQRSVYIPGTTTTYFSLRIPDDFLNDTSYGFSPNNPGYIISADTYGLQLQPFKRTGNGANVDAYNGSYNGNSYFSILGDGLYGSHFGSGLPAEGGCLRVNELTDSNNVRHALQIELSTYLLYKNTGSNNNRNETFRWPANRSDNDISTYGVENTSNPDVRMGSLLTVRNNVTEASLGLTTSAAKKILWALQNYGAYVVDTSGYPSYKPNGADYVNLGIEAGAKIQFRNTYGYEFAVASTDNTAWFRDMNAIYKNLAVVTNNGPTTIGGGGTPRDSGRITALAYGERKNVSAGTQIEAEDYNIGGQNVGYYDNDNTQSGRVYGTDNRDGGGGYRNDGVDVYPTADSDGGASGNWAIGWISSGEWEKYDVNVTSAGSYTISARGASGSSGGTVYFTDENNNVLGGTLTIPGTGNWDTYQTVTSTSFTLSAGNHTICMKHNGGYNVNWFKFNAASGGGGPGPNLVTNPGFESGGGQSPVGWSTWTGAGGDSNDFVEAVRPRTGSLHLTHWNSSQNYQVLTYQTKTGLANGNYTLRAWVIGSNNQNSAVMYVKNYGGTERNVSIKTGYSYTQYTITDVNVTNGQAEIGFWSDANTGQFNSFDDVEFFKQ